MSGLLATKKIKNRGFTLIELAIVLVIVGIMLYTALAVGISKIDGNNTQETENKLRKIQDAITVFYKINNYLPCPASGSTLISSSDFGTGLSQEVGGTPSVNCIGTNVIRDNATTIYAGVVPIRDLSLPDNFAFDSWGNRISYIVSRNCVDADNWNSTNTFKCADGATASANGGKITMRGVNSTIWPVAAAYALISHGKDNLGAWPRAGGSKIPGVAANTLPEKNNGNLDANGVALAASAAVTIYYDKAINDGGTSIAGGDSGNYFDDIVHWKMPTQVYYDANH